MPRGRMTLLSAAERRYCEPMLRGFARRFPDVDLDFVFGISTDLHRRFQQRSMSEGRRRTCSGAAPWTSR